eukprot:GHVU01060506.1.p5 GENE.GHVU01060506.1~~GHVU01060506.1.p5  ORF type:complete len:129 (+),score=10.03 GHVU01060506.1:1473-1859(+)
MKIKKESEDRRFVSFNLNASSSRSSRAEKLALPWGSGSTKSRIKKHFASGVVSAIYIQIIATGPGYQYRFILHSRSNDCTSYNCFDYPSRKTRTVVDEQAQGVWTTILTHNERRDTLRRWRHQTTARR